MLEHSLAVFTSMQQDFQIGCCLRTVLFQLDPEQGLFYLLLIVDS